MQSSLMVSLFCVCLYFVICLTLLNFIPYCIYHCFVNPKGKSYFKDLHLKRQSSMIEKKEAMVSIAIIPELKEVVECHLSQDA